MRFCFADPPYYGLAVKFYGHLHPEAHVYDTIEGHIALIERLCTEFPDGWAMCLHEKSLRTILPLCPEDCRVMAWVKPWCSYKPGVRVAYAWEPIIFRGGRPSEKINETVRDWVSANMEMERGFQGAKPPKVIRHILKIWDARPDEDEVVDLFPGSGIVGATLDNWRHSKTPRQLQLMETPPCAAPAAQSQSRVRRSGKTRKSVTASAETAAE